MKIGPKKPSGNAFQKIKKNKEKTAAILSGQLNNWLKPNKEDTSAVTDLRDESDTTEDFADILGNCGDSQLSTSSLGLYVDNAPSFEDSELIEERMSIPSPDENVLANDYENTQPPDEECSTAIDEIVYDDPKKWPGIPEISDKVRLLLVERGPQTVDVSTFKFPDSDHDRHLDAKWFYKTLANSEQVLRQWLLYSQSEDALFCFPCLLFGKGQHGKTPPFVDINKGFKDWKHLNPLIYTHENASSHRLCCMEWKELQKRLKLKKPLDAEIQQNIQKEIEKWRNIVKVVVDVILFCAKNNLSLQGTAKK